MLDLSEIKNEVTSHKKKKGKEKKRSPEDIFMLKNIQPATHSPAITNEYFLKIVLAYNGCLCCSNVPDASMPLTIMPAVDDSFTRFKAPSGWNPTCLGTFTIDL